VLQKASTAVNPHYFNVGQPAYHDIVDAAERLVSSSFYSYAIFATFILNSILCRNDIRKSRGRSMGQSYNTRGWSLSMLTLRMLWAEVPRMDGK
jgi:hypothetical protein